MLPVVTAGECVGLVDRAALNLHLTPTMGTELETSREAAMWRKPVNQVMQTQFTTLSAEYDVAQIPFLVRRYPGSPWVLVSGKAYKGIITAHRLLDYLASLH